MRVAVATVVTVLALSVASSPVVASADVEAALAEIKDCESGGNYGIVSSNGLYFGAYQFDMATWRGVGGAGRPDEASAAEQDYRAALLFAARGGWAWPYCGRNFQN